MDAKGHFVGMPQLIAQFQNGLKGMSKNKISTISLVGSETVASYH